MKIFCLPFLGTGKSKNTQKHCEIKYDEFTIVKQLKKSTYPVLLVYCPSTKAHYAVKTFPLQENLPSPSYRRELTIQSFSHQNLIKIYHSSERNDNVYPDLWNVSYILMELAPFGSLFDAIWRKGLPKSETLTRTYFHQLIEGIEFLHDNNIAHTDLKPENLLLGEQYILKIIDFERAKNGSCEKVPGRGTKNYRAPEIRLKTCNLPFTADVYSAGVIMFVMLLHFHPYIEDKIIEGHDLHQLLLDGELSYWSALEECRGELPVVSPEFKELFFKMVRRNPEDRISIQEIKCSKWYCGPTLTMKELKITMSKHLKDKSGEGETC